MISNRDISGINKALEAICNHPLFINSSVYTRLLTYLVEKAIQEEDVKEFTIGADLFGKNYIEDKNDGTVRSYMYKLRKKLAAYYDENEGSHQVIFDLEKGQYNLNFLTRKEYQQKEDIAVLKIPLRTVKMAGILLFMVLLTILSINIFSLQTPALWTSFVENKSDNLVIISDQYVVMERNADGSRNATMFMEMNSDDDLISFRETSPERELSKTDFTLMTKMAPYGIKLIDRWFFKHNSDYRLQLESRLTYDDVKSHNFIFIGQYKTMNLSKSLFLNNSQHFTTYGDGFRFNDGDIDKVYNTRRENFEKIEYVMVSYFTHSADRKALYFTSNNDIGVTATLDNFTNKKWLREFENQLPSKSSYFNALFEVRGLQRTDIHCKLVELEIVE